MTSSADTGIDSTADDEEFLGRVLDQALACIAEGGAPDVDEFVASRPDLREEIATVLRAAFAGAACRGPRVPLIAGYELLSELGRGGMGVVWRARQRRLGRVVALKVLSHVAVRSPRTRARFLRESETLARLRHRNVVTVHDIVVDGETCAYAMEWIEGSSLADALRLRRETTASVLRIGLGIARALAEVHQAGLLHRDVKPSNILLRRDGTPVLADFGLVLDEETERQTISGQFVGTMAYAAPEQLRGARSRIGARADIYSLGVTLYECLAGRTPFRSDSSADLLRAIEAGDAPSLHRLAPQAPIDLVNVIAKAMDPDPSRRYATADELAEDLERITRFEPARARPVAITRKLALFSQRHRRELIVAGAVLIATGVASWTLGREWIHSLGSGARAREHRRLAQLELLDPDARPRLWHRTVKADGAESHAPPDIPYKTVLREYEAALAETPDDVELEVERDVITLAGEMLAAAASARPSVRAARGARPLAAPLAIGPCTLAWASDWHSDPDRAGIEVERLGAATTLDRRSLGLLALLVGRSDVTRAAWETLDLTEPPDPLVQSLLGQLLLQLDKPGAAYPRLLAGARAWPEAGMLAVDVADAAIRCGDDAAAAQWLCRARSAERRPLRSILLRITADLAVARGRPSEGEALYRWMERAGEATPKSRRDHAVMLADRGDRLEAARVLVPVAVDREADRRTLAAFARRWFEEASPTERWRVWFEAITAAECAGPEATDLWRTILAFRQPPDAPGRNPDSLDFTTVAPPDLAPGVMRPSFDDFLDSLEIALMKTPIPRETRRLIAALRFADPSPAWGFVARGMEGIVRHWPRSAAVFSFGVFATTPSQAQSIDMADGFGIEKIATVTRPVALALVPSDLQAKFGRKLFIVCNDQQFVGDLDRVFALDLDTQDVTEFFALPAESDPECAEFNPAGSFTDALYISSNNRDGGQPGDAGGSIVFLEPDPTILGEQFLSSAPPGVSFSEPYLIAFGPGGGFGGSLYVSNASDLPFEIATLAADGAQENFISFGALEHIQIRFGNGGSFGSDLYVSYEVKGVVDMIDANGNATRFATVSGNFQPDFSADLLRHLQFPPEGSFEDFAYAMARLNGVNQLLRFATDGSTSTIASGFLGTGADVLEFSEDGESLFACDADAGLVYRVFACPNLCFDVDPDVATDGDTITLTTSRGEPFKSVLLAATKVNGIPLFVPLLVASFDSNGLLSIPASVPPGLAGIDVELVAFGFPAGQNRMKLSNFDTLMLR